MFPTQNAHKPLFAHLISIIPYRAFPAVNNLILRILYVVQPITLQPFGKHFTFFSEFCELFIILAVFHKMGQFMLQRFMDRMLRFPVYS